MVVTPLYYLCFELRSLVSFETACDSHYCVRQVLQGDFKATLQLCKPIAIYEEDISSVALVYTPFGWMVSGWGEVGPPLSTAITLSIFS